MYSGLLMDSYFSKSASVLVMGVSKPPTASSNEDTSSGNSSPDAKEGEVASSGHRPILGRSVKISSKTPAL